MVGNRASKIAKKGNWKMIDTSLNKSVIEAVDSGLLALGENSRKAIYFHLEKTFNIKKEEIASRFEEFKEALEDIFGPGAELIESSIMRELQTALDREEKEGFELATSVDGLQEIHGERPRRGKME